MGGLFGGGSVVAPVAPIQDNSAQISLMEEYRRQNEMYLEQLKQSNEAEIQSDLAAQENLKEIEAQRAKEEAERIEREKRIKKEKRDLLYMNALGVEDDDDDPMLLLGGY